MTKTFGILAYPAGHSLSPAMHNAAFAELGVDAKYEFFEKSPEELEGFIQEVREKHIDGLSVSIPHKEKIIPLLDKITDAAKEIGAVNTIYWEGDKLMGDNTDWLGAEFALEKDAEIRLTAKRVVVLGGGGAARAIVFALLEKNCEVIVVTREAWEFEGIKKDFGVTTDFVSNLENYSPEILVNATPLGMKGKFEGMSFVDPKWFEKHQPLVFDIVYNPCETKLIKDAKMAGCEILEGNRMFLWQGVIQFHKWFPKAEIITLVPIMEKVIEEELTK